MAKKYLIEDDQEFPAILYQEDIVSGYTDFSDNVVLIDKHGMAVKDYLFVRDDINTILIPKANPNYPTIDFSGWFTGLTQDEKKIMAKYVLAPYALRLTQYTDADDEYNWFELLRITQGIESTNYPFAGRTLLIEKMRKHVANKVRKEQLTIAQTQTFYEETFQLLDWYIRSANPKFKLWLTSQSPYDIDGFNSKSYWSQELEDELMNIYNGIE